MTNELERQFDRARLVFEKSLNIHYIEIHPDKLFKNEDGTYRNKCLQIRWLKWINALEVTKTSTAYGRTP